MPGQLGQRVLEPCVHFFLGASSSTPGSAAAAAPDAAAAEGFTIICGRHKCHSYYVYLDKNLFSELLRASVRVKCSESETIN